MLPLLPRMLKVQLQGDFKDGTLTAEMKAAGFKFYENIENRAMPDQTVWITERLYDKMTNSGAALEILETRVTIPPPTGPTSEAKAAEPAEEPEPEVGEEVIPLTLDDLQLTGPAKRYALDNDITAEELLDTLPEWEVFGGAWAEHKFSMAEVKNLREV